ncbi:MAG: NUDIX hydrolase [Actinomycetota bacterium]|nr:NUDIX hydrolase [Actinomycetota bacterium]
MVSKENVSLAEKKYGIPAERRMRFEINSPEYEMVAQSMVGGRSEDVTIFIKSMNNPDEIAVIRKPFLSPGIYRAPSGGPLTGEALEESAKREAREETGLEIEIKRYLARIDVTFTCGEKPPIEWTSHVFEALQTAGEIGPIDVHEIEEAKWMSLKELGSSVKKLMLESGSGLLCYRVALTDFTVAQMKSPSSAS